MRPRVSDALGRSVNFDTEPDTQTAEKMPMAPFSGKEAARIRAPKSKGHRSDTLASRDKSKRPRFVRPRGA